MKIRIAELMAVVSVSAFAFVAFKRADPLFETLFFSLTLLLVLSSSLLAIGKRDPDRAFWTGFAISSLSYLAFAHLPYVDEMTTRYHGPEITTQSLRCAFHSIHDDTMDSNFSPGPRHSYSLDEDPFAADDYNDGDVLSVLSNVGGTSADTPVALSTNVALIVSSGQRITADRRSFFRIGHSAWALLLC